MRLAPLLVLLGLVSVQRAQAQADAAGSSDHRLFPRIAGYAISSHRDSDPVAEVFRTGETRRDTVEGRVTRLLYSLPRGRQEPTTQLGLVQHYEQLVQRLGGVVLYRHPTYGYLHARVVREGREFWLRVERENTTEYNVVVAERSAPVQAASVALGASNPAAACPCEDAAAPGEPVVPSAALARRFGTPAARRLTAAAARFALDTSSQPVVLPATGTHRGVVSIRGLRVEDATAVRFGDYDATIVARRASEIAVVVPARPAGMTTVVVLSPAGARTARDSFLVYREPVDEQTDQSLRIYTCTESRLPDAPIVTSFEPATVRPGDTLTIRGRGLDQPSYVDFTYRERSLEGLGRRPDRNWAGDTGDFLANFEGAYSRRMATHAALPLEQTATTITIVVPARARTGPVALFGYGACVASDLVLGVRTAPAPR